MLASALEKLTSLERFVLAVPPSWMPLQGLALPRSPLLPAYLSGMSAWTTLTHLDLWATTFCRPVGDPPSFALRTLLLKEVTISGTDLGWLLGSTSAAGSLTELALVYVIPPESKDDPEGETASLASSISSFLSAVGAKLEKVHVELDRGLLAEPLPALPSATHVHLGGRGIGALPASYPSAKRFRLSFTPLIPPSSVLGIPPASNSLSSLEIDIREPFLRTQLQGDPASWDFTRDDLVQLNRLCRLRRVRFLYGGLEFEEPSGDEAEEDVLEVDLDAPFQLSERAIREYEREKEEDRRIRAMRPGSATGDEDEVYSDSSMI
jgi:hypothetical protein